MEITVTFDVFSALIDSRTGGSAFFAELAEGRPWTCSPTDVYDRWDAHNKSLHRQNQDWCSYTALAGRALAVTYRDLGLPDTADEDCPRLLASMARWPLWPDISAGAFDALPARSLGLLTNIDDILLAGTSARQLGVFDPAMVWTSQRARAYKPSADFYHRARQAIGPLVHVASSARDVRGTLEADIACVRLNRPGHTSDPAGPQPRFEAESFNELPAALTRLLAEFDPGNQAGPPRPR